MISKYTSDEDMRKIRVLTFETANPADPLANVHKACFFLLPDQAPLTGRVFSTWHQTTNGAQQTKGKHITATTGNLCYRLAWWYHQWNNFPHYWHFVRGIHRSPVNSPHKGQWRWTLMFSLICAWKNAWINNRYASDLRPHCTHYDVTVMDDSHSCKPYTWLSERLWYLQQIHSVNTIVSHKAIDNL